MTAALPNAHRSRLRPAHIRLYHLCDLLSEGLIYLILKSPGPWALWDDSADGRPNNGHHVWFLRSLADCCSSRFLFKAIGQVTNRRCGTAAASSESPDAYSRSCGPYRGNPFQYCLVSALNPRSAWRPQTNSFDYFSCIAWLPHSYDQSGTWQSFWNYSAIACVFWALRDWLTGLTPSEEQTQRANQRGGATPFRAQVFIPARLRRLLWLLSVNGVLLGLEGNRAAVEWNQQ